MRSIPTDYIGLKQLVEMLVVHLHGPKAAASLGAIEIVSKGVENPGSGYPEKYLELYVGTGDDRIRLNAHEAQWDNCRDRVQRAFILGELSPQVQDTQMSRPANVDPGYWPSDWSWRSLISGRYDDPHEDDSALSGQTIFVDRAAASKWVLSISTSHKTEEEIKHHSTVENETKAVLAGLKAHGQNAPGADNYFGKHILGKSDISRDSFRVLYSEIVGSLGMKIRGAGERDK